MVDILSGGGFTFKVTESVSSAKKKMEEAFVEAANPVFIKAVPKIQMAVRKIIARTLFNSKTYEELINGDLRLEIGIPEGEANSRLRMILAYLIEDIRVTFKPLKRKGGSFSGGFKVFIIKEDFQKIVNIPEAQIVTDKGQVLKWLYWMLFEGDKIILNNFVVKYGDFEASRSGGAIMVEVNRDPAKMWTGMQELGWAIPKEHSGVQDNNWISRALYDKVIEILDMIADATQEAIESSI